MLSGALMSREVSYYDLSAKAARSLMVPSDVTHQWNSCSVLNKPKRARSNLLLHYEIVPSLHLGVCVVNMRGDG